MKKIALTAATVLTAAMFTAPVAAAFTGDEQKYLSDLDAIDVINSGGNSSMVTAGWKICTLLAQGYERPWVAKQLYLGSQNNNGAAGVDYQHALAIVYYANADLCSEVN